jgi:chromatin segregation and condensation protein Rec8/ScpA/Scc1 (kleisin family)
MEHLYYSITNFNDPAYSYSMSVENDELIEQNSEEIEMEDDNEGKVAIVEETVELSEPGRVVREEVTRIENLREYEEQEEEEKKSKGVEKKGSLIESTTTKNIDYVAKQLEEQTNQIKKLTDTILPLQTHVQSQFEMLQDVQSNLNKLQTTVEDIIKSKKVINSRAKQPAKKIGNTKKHKSKKLAKRTKR